MGSAEDMKVTVGPRRARLAMTMSGRSWPCQLRCRLHAYVQCISQHLKLGAKGGSTALRMVEPCRTGQIHAIGLQLGGVSLQDVAPLDPCTGLPACTHA